VGKVMRSPTPTGLDKPVGIFDSTNSWSARRRGHNFEMGTRTGECFCYDTDQILNSIAVVLEKGDKRCDPRFLYVHETR